METKFNEARFKEARALHLRGQLAQAKAIYQEILKVNPDHADSLHLLGVIASHVGKHKLAIDLIGKAASLDPENVNYLLDWGNALHVYGRLDLAVKSHERAITLQPDYAEAYSNLGAVLYEQGDLKAALARLEQAIALNPKHDGAHFNRGNVLTGLTRFLEAVESYDRAIALNPKYAEAYANRGVALYDLKKLDAARRSYDTALQLQPNYPDVYINRGNVHRDLKTFEAAAADYAQALDLDPGAEFLFGLLLHTKYQLCQWQDYEAEIASLAAQIKSGAPASHPFPVLALTDSPHLQRLATEKLIQVKYPLRADLGPLFKTPVRDKIRLGYFSADFREHPVSYLTAELFESHDKSKFELIAFSFGPREGDDMRRRVSAAFNHFIDVTDRSDLEVAQLAREQGIDIAIDLSGHTQHGRPGIFSYRAAPVQLSYLGYLGTMGADYFDYLIADKTLIPSGSEADYTEKIVTLPSYQVNDSQRPISGKVFTREELGLPSEGFVFCCFNLSYKITPQVFEGWMRILKAVDSSVLWLLEHNATATHNLLRHAEHSGVNRERIRFGKMLPRAEYLARFRAADLFLDTLPYNAGTIASDALWAGLPVLTQMGESFASRVAGSVLNAIDLPELVTETQEAYEAKAIELASHATALRDIKRKIQDNRLTTPLFNCMQFTQHIEAAYTAMHERVQAGLPPADIEILS